MLVAPVQATTGVCVTGRALPGAPSNQRGIAGVTPRSGPAVAGGLQDRARAQRGRLYRGIGEPTARWPRHSNGVTTLLEHIPAALNHPHGARCDNRNRAGLRDYQAATVAALVDEYGLHGADAAQVIHACGTGKTVTAATAASALLAGLTDRLVIVAAPTKLLVTQLIGVFHSFGSYEETLAVFSGADNRPDSEDNTAPSTAPYDVLLDAGQASDWLRHHTRGARLVVTTHVSAAVVADALRRSGQRADLLVVDEAHHVAGRTDKLTAVVNDRHKMPATRRLYLSATPRIGRDRLMSADGEADTATVDMSDTTVFGRSVHPYTFNDAITDKWLAPYQVLVVAVPDEMVAAELAGHQQDQRDASLRQVVTAQIALAQVIRNHGVRRILAFTRTIALADAFAKTFPTVAAMLPKDQQPGVPVISEAISGNDPMPRRRAVLDQLAAPGDDHATAVANAKALSEGVDVPAVDCVTLVNPRGSIVDIIQIVGRALRPHPAGPRSSVVLLPMVVGPDGAKDDDAWAATVDALDALRLQDPALGVELDKRAVKAHAGTPKPGLPQQVTFDFGLARHLIPLAQHMELQLLQRTTSRWVARLGELERYLDEHNRLRDGRQRTWALDQCRRNQRGELPAEKWEVLAPVLVRGFLAEEAFQEAKRQARRAANLAGPNDRGCTEHECPLKHYAGGLCQPHHTKQYMEKRRKERRCSACGGEYYANGYCSACYTRHKRWGDPQGGKRSTIRPRCESGCGRVADTPDGLCVICWSATQSDTDGELAVS